MEAGAPLVYVNCVGGQDELVFDGDSLVVDAAGTVIARAPLWQEGLMVVDLDCAPAGSDHGRSGRRRRRHDHDGRAGDADDDEPCRRTSRCVHGIAAPLGDEEEVWGALVTAMRDYVGKNRFRSVVLGLSGGIDSALVAAIARDALGPDAVHVVGMPSAWSSDHSVSDAEDLASGSGCTGSSCRSRRWWRRSSAAST